MPPKAPYIAPTSRKPTKTPSRLSRSIIKSSINVVSAPRINTTVMKKENLPATKLIGDSPIPIQYLKYSKLLWNSSMA